MLRSCIPVLLLASLAASLPAQGPLTPPAAPAPTMKSLDQIESRTPISSLPSTISASGSYYLTGNLSLNGGTAITISADDVTLDLNGFTISSTSVTANGSAINFSGTRRGVRIRNGAIRGTTTVAGGVFTAGGFVEGIINSSDTAANLVVEDVRVSGVANNGIRLATPAASSIGQAFRCAVSICSGRGLSAGLVQGCRVEFAGGVGIFGDVVLDSWAQSVGSNTNFHGIQAVTLVDRCRGAADAGRGIDCDAHVSNSVGVSNTAQGIVADIATNSTGQSTSGIGLNAVSALNCTGTSVSAIGMSAQTATNCAGNTTSGSIGLSASGTASSCRGRRDGGIAINAGIAIGCSVSGTGTINSANKFLGTP